MDLRGISGFCDFFVIASGESTRRVQAIADNIQSGLAQKGDRASHSEGEKDGKWVLIDCGDVIAHVFYAETRKFYEIERLWHDAPKETIQDDEHRKS